MKNGKQFSVVTDGVMAGGDLYEINELLFPQLPPSN